MICHGACGSCVLLMASATALPRQSTTALHRLSVASTAALASVASVAVLVLRLSGAANPNRLRQHLRHSGPTSNISAMVPNAIRSGSASIFAIAVRTIRHSGPASNKPYSVEKSTPVWLAIWRTCAGFANSQLRRATFSSTYLYMCLSTLLPHRAAAQTQQICRPICTYCLRHLRITAE